MKYLLLATVLFCLTVQAQTDTTITESIIIVKDGSNTLINKYYKNARIESPHAVKAYKTVKEVPKGDLQEVPAEGYIEKDKVYLIKGVAYIADEGYNKEKGDEDLASVFSDKTEKEKADDKKAIEDSIKAAQDTVKAKDPKIDKP